MSYFKAKMHQNQFLLGLRPRPRWGAYSAPPNPLAGFTSSKGGEGGKEGNGRGKGMGRGGGKDLAPQKEFLAPPL